MVALTNEIFEDVEEIHITANDQFLGEGMGVEATKTGCDFVQYVLKVIKKIHAQSKGNGSKMQEMQHHSEHISMILDTISSIANQTNLLALNAKIEAARAGEHGKWFSIVVSEVGKLADDTDASTTEISELVEMMQKNFNETTKAMELSMEDIDGSANLAQTAGDFLMGIHEKAEGGFRFGE